MYLYKHVEDIISLSYEPRTIKNVLVLYLKEKNIMLHWRPFKLRHIDNEILQTDNLNFVDLRITKHFNICYSIWIQYVYNSREKLQLRETTFLTGPHLIKYTDWHYPALKYNPIPDYRISEFSQPYNRILLYPIKYNNLPHFRLYESL